MHMRRRFLFSAIAFALSGCVGTTGGVFRSGEPLSAGWAVAVSPAVEYVEQPRPTMFGEEVSRYVTEGLMAGAPIRDVAWRFDGTRRIWDAAAEQSRKVRVPILALGQYVVTSDGVTLTYRLVNESGYVLASATETITRPEERVAVARRLGERLADLLRGVAAKGGAA